MSRAPFLRSLNNERGLSIVETLIAFGILGVVSVVLMQGISSVSQMKQVADTTSSVDKQINNIVENIRVNSRAYQIAFSLTPTAREAMLKEQNLPIAWSANVIADVKSCATCPGRAGYVIQTLDGMAGLYLVTVRFTHSAWNGQPRDYQFVVSP